MAPVPGGHDTQEAANRVRDTADAADHTAHVLLVDGETVVATPGDLAGASVSARVVGTTKGPKIRGFKYKNKSRSRTHWGHRQKYTTIEITGISKGS